jgi:hypothetical protein
VKRKKPPRRAAFFAAIGRKAFASDSRIVAGAKTAANHGERAKHRGDPASSGMI